MKQQLLLGLFSCIALTALGQTSIFGGLSLHHDAQLAFFDAPVHFVEGNIAAAEENDAFVVLSAAQPLSANDNSHVETPS